MKVLVVGASGFIGTRLVGLLQERGHEVVVSGRDEGRLRKAFGSDVAVMAWDPNSGPLTLPEGVEAVVNLAGESVQGRWTKAKKKRIRDSRVEGTKNLVAGIAAAGTKPRVLVQGSAVGYYGDHGHLALYEDSTPAGDFLGEVCQEWEAEATRARESGLRTAIVRTGVVLGKGGGAYPPMTRPFRMFLGGYIGTGRRWMSWIHLDDIAGIFAHCLESEAADGVFNGTAPHPVSNGEFSDEVARALKRPVMLPVPPLAIRLLLGGFSEVVLASQRVEPVRTLGIGYEFKFPTIRAAVEDLR